MPVGEWDPSKSELCNRLRLIAELRGVNDPELAKNEHLSEELRRYFGIEPMDDDAKVRRKVVESLVLYIDTIRPKSHRIDPLIFRHCVRVTYGIHEDQYVLSAATIDDRRKWMADNERGTSTLAVRTSVRYWNEAVPLLEDAILRANPHKAESRESTSAPEGSVKSGAHPKEPTSTRQAEVDLRLEPLFDSLVKKVKFENDLQAGMFLNPIVLPVRWKPHEGSAANATESLSGQGTATEANGPKEMATLYNQLTRRQLIVIGEAGSGKTTMAVQVQRELLTLRSDHDPIPVVFPLASWNPVALSLYEWMWRRLGYQFDSLGRLMSTVLDEGLDRDFIRRHIVPILDGFDEIPRSLHDQAADALQIALGTDSAAIITCRTKAYAHSSFLPAAQVVRLEPLALNDSRQYLTAVSSKWETVFTGRAGSTQSLSNALRTPLMVWLSGRVYRARQNDPSMLFDFADHEAIESHLLGGLVGASFSRAGATDSQRLTSGADGKDASRWLGFLAYGLLKVDPERERRDIAWTELIKLVPWRSVGLGVSLAMGALLGLEANASLSLELGQLVSFVFGIWFGFGFGRAYSTMRSKDYASHGRTGLFSGIDPELSEHLVRLGFGILCALLAGGAAFGSSVISWGHRMVAVHQRMPHADISLTLLLCGVGAVVCCIIGLVGGFAAFRKLSSDPKADEKYAAAMANSPAEAVRRDGTYAALRTFLIGTAITGVVTAAVLWLGMRSNIWVGLACGWSGGLAGTFVFAAWPRYRFAHVWLVLTGKLPFKLMAFLSDAHTQGVIRQTAVAYEFRHDLLQRALADAYKERFKTRSLDR